MARLKIGVIGVGHMGKYHVNVLSQISKKIDFVGVYDLNRDKATQIAQEYDIRAFISVEEAIQEMDAVILAIPTSKHYEIGKKVLTQKKHLLIEKPMTNDLEQARDLIETTKKNKLKLMVGHVERYNGAIQELSQIIQQPLSWESRRVSSDTGRIFDVGVTLDLLIHDIDIAHRMIKGDIVDIQAQACKVFTDFEDMLQCQIKFSNNCLASFLVSRVHHQKERTLRITEKDCDLILDFATQDISIFKEGKSTITTQKESISYRQQSSVERVFIHKENPLRLEIEDFITCIENDVSIDNELDFKTLEVSMQIIDLIKI